LAAGAAVLAMLASGCGSAPATETASGDAPADADGLTIGIVFDTGGRGDKSFNDSAWRGLERAQKELGIKVLAVDSKSEKDYAANIAGAADRGADLVIAVGISMQSALEQAAKEYPDSKFAIVDASMDLPNVRSLLFTEHEGSFLVGYLAGLMSKSGKIGFIGGQELPLIKKFEVGYRAGAWKANPGIEVLPPKYTGSWDDIDKARIAANLLYGQGADIIYHAAGRSGLGLIRAAKDQGKWAIGVDSDQDDIEPGSVLTSMIKRVDEAVFQTVKDLTEGKFEAGDKVYDLAANGVGTSDFKNTKEQIGADNLEKLETVRKEIASGSLKVPQTEEELQAMMAG
ncbi:MAG: BMP family ABC transporter substrate-binding protein, partial [Fimbriimonadaceae bacterium]|nr:BMP family ABC transporter substrate-binding protein [Fimbriimonadaceae bacterium]